MIVNDQNFHTICKNLMDFSTLVVDTETTGLRPYDGDFPFSVIIYAGGEHYYFNFNGAYEGENIPVLTPDKPFLTLFTVPRTYVFHNAKFDIKMLENIGVTFHRDAKIYCTMTAERVVKGNHPGKGDFSLDAMARKYGYTKSDAVEKYVSEHKLYEDVEVPGKKRKVRNKFYYQVPFDIITAYGRDDVLATAGIYVKQLEEIERLRETRAPQQPDIKDLLHQEMDLLKVVYDMENRGVRIDGSFCRRAVEHYAAEIQRAEEAFESGTGKAFKPGSKLYKEIFKDEKWVYTAKGNPSFRSDVIDNFEGEEAQLVKSIRKNKHLMDTYNGFLYAADPGGFIHTNLNQHLTRTGRFSSSAPNLQNMEKAEGEDLKAEFTPRRAIIPREGNYFGMIDYRQMEYRMMLDYAGAHDLIRKVNDGMDVHQAMADKVGFPRSKVKNANFAILYGAGDATLASTMGGTLEEAKALRAAIYGASPEIAKFIDTVQYVTQRRAGRYLWNWAGRMFWFQDLHKLYKAPNALIQGGCADVVKRAMVRVGERHPQALVLTIHDELVIEAPYDDTDIVKSVCQIMREVYKPLNGMRLDVSAEWSKVSLADKEEWCG